MKAIDYIRRIEKFNSSYGSTLMCSLESISVVELETSDKKCIELLNLISDSMRVSSVITTEFQESCSNKIFIERKQIRITSTLFRPDTNPLIPLNEYLNAVRYRLYTLKELDL